jgi:carbamoyl-phosphate synthase large subunit
MKASVPIERKLWCWGAVRIASGKELSSTTACVHGVLAAKECGYETIMINCNPETVSTDSDTADKLYFEPVFWEHIYDIILHEKPEGVIVPIRRSNRTESLLKNWSGLESPSSARVTERLIWQEDRGSFSTLLREQGVPYPEFGVG